MHVHLNLNIIILEARTAYLNGHWQYVTNTRLNTSVRLSKYKIVKQSWFKINQMSTLIFETAFQCINVKSGQNTNVVISTEL